MSVPPVSLPFLALLLLAAVIFVLYTQFQLTQRLTQRPHTTLYTCAVHDNWTLPTDALSWSLSAASASLTTHIHRELFLPSDLHGTDSLPSDFAWSDFVIADMHLLDDPIDESIYLPPSLLSHPQIPISHDNQSLNLSLDLHRLQDLSPQDAKIRQIQQMIAMRRSRTIQAPHPLVFIHIPKTAGTTVSKYLEENWKLHSQCAGVLSRHRKASRAEIQRMKAKSKGKCLFTIVWHRSVPVSVFKKWTLSDKIDFHYEHGHHPIGLCAFFGRDCHYTTVFREPIERTVSHYYYLRTLPENFAPFVRELNYNYSTMDLFLDAVEQRKFFHYGLFNMHTLMLAGDGAWNFLNNYALCNMGRNGCDVRPDFLTWAHVDIAKRNLLRMFPIIGLTDRLVEYGVLMKLRYGYPFMLSLCGKENANKQAHRNDSLTPQQLARIQHINRFDIELYRFAEALHEIQVREAGAMFDYELKVAREKCAQDIIDKQEKERQRKINEALGIPMETPRDEEKIKREQRRKKRLEQQNKQNKENQKNKEN